MRSGPNPPPFEADVLIDADVPVDQERLLADMFALLGVTARTRVVPARRGAVVGAVAGGDDAARRVDREAGATVVDRTLTWRRRAYGMTASTKARWAGGGTPAKASSKGA